MKKTEKEDYIDPDKRHLKIDEDFKRAQIVALRVNTLSKYLELGFPVRFAIKLSGIELDESEIKSLEKSRKDKKSKK
jgi:hypothetical protein